MSIQPDSKPMQQVEPQIRIRNLNVSYVNTNKKIKSKHFHILKNINLDLHERQITAILGASGGGKTTFTETLKGNVPLGTLTSGKITLDSQRPGENENLEVHRTYENWLIQSSLDGQHEMQITEMIVMDFLMLIVGYTRPELKTYNEKELVIFDVLDNLDISDKSHSLIKSLSGGQQKRLKIAEAILVNKQYILLDEPTSGLDDMSAYNILRYLKKLCDEQDKTIIITIHQPNGALFDFIDHLVMIHNGRVFFSGKESEAISHMEKYGIFNTKKRDATFFLVETANSKEKVIVDKLEEMIRDYMTEETKELKYNENLYISDSKISFKHILANLKFLLFHSFISFGSILSELSTLFFTFFIIYNLKTFKNLTEEQSDTELDDIRRLGIINYFFYEFITIGSGLSISISGLMVSSYKFCSNSSILTKMIDNLYFTKNSYFIASFMALYCKSITYSIIFVLIFFIYEQSLNKTILTLILSNLTYMLSLTFYGTILNNCKIIFQLLLIFFFVFSMFSAYVLINVVDIWIILLQCTGKNKIAFLFKTLNNIYLNVLVYLLPFRSPSSIFQLFRIRYNLQSELENFIKNGLNEENIAKFLCPNNKNDEESMNNAVKHAKTSSSTFTSDLKFFKYFSGESMISLILTIVLPIIFALSISYLVWEYRMLRNFRLKLQ